MTFDGHHEIIMLWRILDEEACPSRGRNVNKLGWIKELIAAEQQMEDAGVVDMTAGFDADRQLVSVPIVNNAAPRTDI